MNKLKVGDRVICHFKLGKIVSAYSTFDEEKDFEIIALDSLGYFFYVPDYYNLSGTFLIKEKDIKKMDISTKFLGCQALYANDSHVAGIKQAMDGMSCSSCKQFSKYAEANQEDGSFRCWSCSAYPYYKSLL